MPTNEEVNSIRNETMGDDEPQGGRTDSTPAAKDFVDRLAEGLDAAEENRSTAVLTVNDYKLRALFEALDEDDDRMREFLDGTDYSPDVSRSELLRYLIRQGVRATDDDLLDEATTAAQRTEEF